ncbi:hypothetical protein ACFFX1_05940 [Dactylosporangium sucinum]|uniref:Prenyltransferase n=1 Tax=Dactylosporangium sucinum TaxID=1424081 RepID=A0A917X647_9ACTN|nr:hypothetical protein [Dactylosporangium sucinum]GGM85429.1 hypothetical protein GCM10007977_104010 [Dactylosporangium sucinum]
MDRSTGLDCVEALLAAVDWRDDEGGWPGSHTGPTTDAPSTVRDLWHTAKLLDLLGTAAQAPAWAGTDNEL